MPAEDSQENLQLLLDVCQLLSSKLELADVLTSIMELSSRVVKAETASLLLLDPETRELYFDVALGLDPEVSKIRLKLGQGVAGTVAKEGKPAIINDVRADPRWSSVIDKQSGFVTRSVLAVPMEIKGKLIGVVEAINHIDGPFSFMDLRIFEAFAAQAAIAIDNARLFSSLREEKSKFETVFARMNEAAMLIDDRGTAVLSNKTASKYFADGDRSVKTIEEAFASFQVLPPLCEVLLSDKPVVDFEAVREKPKRLIFSGTASMLRFDETSSVPGWNGRLFVLRDVTDEKKEDLLKRSFLSLISHKLKTPLASVTGYAQILLEDSDSPRPDLARKSLETILAQGRKLSELVDKLLKFTTLEDLDTSAFVLKPFKIDELISETVKSMGPWLSAQNGTALIEAGCSMTALGDPSLIKDVLKNLIENGIKFNPNREKKVAIWAERDNGRMAVHVKDTGTGIPPEDQDKIFNKFHQVESSFTGQVEGCGLGLPFVKKVVEHHGGKVTLRSRINEGTTVTFTLPLCKQS